MTVPPDPYPYLEQLISRLTGRGAQFEIVMADVLGTEMPVMRNRDRAVADLLSQSLAWGDREYLVTADRRITFAEHARESYALATALRERYGVSPGDRVAILSANRPEWVTAFWATQALGAITVGLNAWWVQPELEFGIGHSRPRVVFVDGPRLDAVADLDRTGTIVLTVEEDLPRLIAEFDGAQPPPPRIDEDDPAVLLYTSGTSGYPKGALHSQRNLLAVVDYHRYSDAIAAAWTGEVYDRTTPSEARHLLTSPLFHITSLHNTIVPRLATGSTVVMNQGWFDVRRVLELIEGEQVTHWNAVPSMAARMLEVEDIDRFDLTSLTRFTMSSEPSTPEFKARLREKLPFGQHTVVDSYAITECSTSIAVASALELERYPGTVGQPIITVSLEIRDPEGGWLPDEHAGEVCVRSPFVMLGYWDDEEATAKTIAPDRWLRTGDYGVVENGRLRLLGRRADLIQQNGENIYPSEVERTLSEHPAVRECLVTGVPHPDWGQEVLAVVVVVADSTVTKEDLTRFVAERLAYFKVPTQWRLTRDLLPRNATGKIVRRGWDGTGDSDD
ncbi:class I adenylate-forming enzyme family protein [Rhodococcus chondri]|uniref:Class I adenylate-forming enzyme family protein n=1 Tax=Rhodococcus chondri TaxID=3065941 RepID=A0ABU7JQH4_9NOCA|nr:class I adenylate-forming enzyme family protein [Rhodococcus sp. CC-R104]MEE2032284.1 class I adenylate-forming enzyme family protein [Rhodococcus sp. CC-R104]